MQVGGRHYKTLPIEPWDYIAANKLGFFEGQHCQVHHSCGEDWQ